MEGPKRAEEERELASRLLAWWEKSGRDYPWRRERDPYRVLIAELMLQRTKADQVAAVYPSFLERFPTPRALAEARLQDVKDFFGRLGLTWRAEKVKKLGEVLERNFSGRVPDTREELLSLPGVGEYVADAVLASLHAGDVVAVDVNVCRIVGRLFDMKARGEARRDPKFREAVQRITPEGRARELHWAMIDFGALVCTSRNPKCSICPLNEMCAYAGKRKKNAVGSSDV